MLRVVVSDVSKTAGVAQILSMSLACKLVSFASVSYKPKKYVKKTFLSLLYTDFSDLF